MTTKPVVIITGVSKGIGLAAAQLFTAQGWIVVGTVRGRDYPAELSTCGVDVQMAEMTRPADLERVVKQAHDTYGHIDTVVANAGYGLLGALEDLTHDQIVEQLAVNTVAVADLVRLVLPQMRKRGRGTLVAVSSFAGRVGLPGYGAYNASKFALEGLFESLTYEVEGSGIRVKLVEPSTVMTSFWDSSLHKVIKDSTEPVVKKTLQRNNAKGLSSAKVARVIFVAASDDNGRLHYPVGLTRWVMVIRRVLPDSWFRRLLKAFI